MNQLPTRRAVVVAGAAAALAPALPAYAAPAARTAPHPPTGAALKPVQPYASYWYPDSLPAGSPGPGITWRSLASWRAESDPDLAFNAASVPLAARFTPTAANTTARAGQARVQSLVSFGPTASNPSQGAPTADYYALTHWAYLDELVFWGGSSGEGLILAPNAPVVDAAHRHGVPVLGNVFLPPAAYGGQLQWTRDLVRKDAAGHYPLAERLVAVAAAYGFDGWFVNAETGGGNTALALDMRGFLTELKQLGAARGQRVTWYDAMTANGSVSWQGALNSQNEAFFRAADTMFLDFRWTAATLASSGAKAGQLGRDRYQLWAGVDVESHGWDTPVDWDAIVPAAKPGIASYGFYRPEWTRNHLPESRTPGDFHAADDRFWTGSSLDPSRPAAADPWRAPATAVADRSTITALPFATTFNTGHGVRWYDGGAVTSSAPWNHLGLQDRLPSRRWVTRTDGRHPAVAFDFEDAWRGGSSVLVTGEPGAPVTLDLYATRLPLSPRTVIELTHRADADVTVEPAVATAEPARPGDPYPYRLLPATTLKAGAWTTTRLALPGLSGTARAVGVRLTAQGALHYRLGALAIHDGPQVPSAPDKLTIAAGSDGLRLTWRPAPGPVRHYELHRLLPDGTRRFLGGTCQSAYFVPGALPEPGEKSACFEVRAVGELYTASGPARAAHTW
ncbi:endo-beta-N-acetylglucosaminidase [Streptomyces sp. NBC_00083]|uniref:endo-beta-N-acetylglucosaminidase n=1 Tax=Streptomyces sp. NBC_00083 TaxID=2975647 RepID=UPI00224DA7FF|nr:endo-beta-N-acetylglucosaminidase [Streptomyces sp. NBC_00083]MCX5385776.1 endo-beta-N-acetylglucosaminidase [Streptomyces sp. NBC_00083]